MLLLPLFLSILHPVAEAASGYRLSKRVNLRYQDVIVTKEGTRWCGKIVESGDVYRIRLTGQSEIAIPKEDISSVTRELNPVLLHTGQVTLRVTPGVEAAFVIADENGGPQYGLFTEAALGVNFGGSFEPEITLTMTPVGPDDGRTNLELGLGLRYYIQPDSKTKAFTNTQIVMFGSRGDLGLRTGPGFTWDIGQNFGFGIHQGVTLLIQDDPEAVAVGYHVGLTGQGRF